MATLSEWAGPERARPEPALPGSAGPDWLAALGGLPNAPQPRWFDALAGDAGFRSGAPFAALLAHEAEAQDTPAPAPTPALAPDTAPTDDAAAALEQAFADGEAAGRAAALAEAQAAAQTMRALRLSFRALDEAARAVLAEELAATVMALCSQVLGDYAVDAEALAVRCNAAAARLGGGAQGAVLRLHPDDLAALGADALPGWHTAADPALARGALVIEGPDGAVRDGPEDWRRALAEALRP